MEDDTYVKSITKQKGLTVKDLIVMGVFAALLTVCSMIGGVFFAITPTLTFYFSIGAALLSGPVFLLLLAKVPKRAHFLLLEQSFLF